MIDVHCHLEQKDYNKDREQVIDACRKELKAVITSCAHPSDFELTMRMVENHPGFVFASCGIHPEYVKEISEEDLVIKNKEKIVAIGETGLDYWYIKEKDWQQKQKELFIELIGLAKELGKPLIIHSREVFDETLDILENQDAERVMFHMWGANQLLQRILDNGWFVSMNTIVLKSKKHKKIARDIPLNILMLETDSPWLAPKRLLDGLEVRNDPRSIKTVAEKVSEIKKLPFEEIWQKCGENAVKFFDLGIG
jgi:TatD DNase family protein